MNEFVDKQSKQLFGCFVVYSSTSHALLYVYVGTRSLNWPCAGLIFRKEGLISKDLSQRVYLTQESVFENSF